MISPFTEDIDIIENIGRKVVVTFSFPILLV